MPQVNCITGPQPSRIPGNIGTLNSQVKVWEHDPLWARSQQIYSWPFSKESSEQQSNLDPNILFIKGTAVLKPVYKIHDMFICTVNPQKASEEDIGGPISGSLINTALGVDFVGSQASGRGLIAQPKLPGGKVFNCDGGRNNTEGTLENPGPCYRRIRPSFFSVANLFGREFVLRKVADPTTGKSIFPHQVWRYIGNLFDSTVLIHPSEYNKVYSEYQNRDNFTEEQLESSPRWDYAEITDNGKDAIWPFMRAKHSSGSDDTTHWSIEKWTPLWQGEDFVISIRLGDKKTNDAVDPQVGDTISTKIASYKYLMYQVPPLENMVQGISNKAFYIAADVNAEGEVDEEAETKASKARREVYDWRYKTYILVEVGVHDLKHRYFIEIVKGRNPRFLHLGEEWDNPNRLNLGIGQSPEEQQAGFEFILKCRELSVYDGVSCDKLFKGDFRFTVQNNIGRIIITFEGYEDNPWVITRRDTNPQNTDFEDKIVVPMVVPAAPVRIHGGNISCKINFSPLRYIPNGTVVFTNRQVDTGEATNKDIYMTFSQLGHSQKYQNDNVRKKFFNDERLAYFKAGYDCDAFVVSEIHSNRVEEIEIYEEYREQYEVIGKGWTRGRRLTEEDWLAIVGGTGALVPVSNYPVGFNAMKPPAPARGSSGSRTSSSQAVPSKLSIINARNPARPFPLTLIEATDQSYPYREFVAKWDVGVVWSAGTPELPVPEGDGALPIENDNLKPAAFDNSVTPIATNWTMIVLAGGKPFGSKFPGDIYSRGSPNVKPFDISPLVQKMTDSWSAEDFFSLKHEMQLECYIPLESTSSEDPLNATPEQSNLFALGRKLIALHNKGFYLTISYWWDTGIGHRGVIGNKLNIPGKDPVDNDLLIQMTGLSYGAELQRSNNLLIMKFTVKDYMTILEKQFIFNSPFFDAVEDVQAIHDLAKMAGFDDSPGRPRKMDRRPLAYLRKVLDDGGHNGERKFLFNGEESRSDRYDLPGSYASFAEPSVKFQEGETYESAMKRIAQLSAKAIYFDQRGVLRLETLPAISAAFASSQDDVNYKTVFDFVSTPIVREGNIPSPGEGGEADEFIFNAREHAAHLVYNTLTYQRSVEDCVNQIILLSASNDIQLADGSKTGGFIIEGYTFFEQIWDPESEGFLGFRKPFYQSNGIFGGQKQVRDGLAHYAKMKFPPVIMSFETYGVPGLKALDIISLDGNIAYITEISHDLDAKSNKWWMNITAEWLKPFKGELGFLKNVEPTNIGIGLG